MFLRGQVAWSSHWSILDEFKIMPNTFKQWMHAYKEPLEQAKEYFAGRIRKTEGKD